MNKKLTGVLIVLAGALALAAIVYFIFVNSGYLDGLLNGRTGENVPAANVPRYEAEETGDQPSDKPAAQRIIAGQDDPEPETDGHGERKSEFARMAASFAERFGSYSNQSNFSNITDLKIFMSQRMKDWADSYVEERRRISLAGSDIYYGITTKAVGQEIEEFDDDAGKISVMVRTRRREAAGSTGNTSNIFDQYIMINFVQEKGVWKVDGAIWQKQ